MLKRDYGQEVAETARVGFLILMAPDDLQGTVLEHADRLREYRPVKEKMVMLLDARGQLKDPNAMDIGYSGEEDWTWETELAISMCVPLGGATTANAVEGWGTSQASARLRMERRKEKRTRGSSATGMKGHEKGKGKNAGGKVTTREKEKFNIVRSLWEAWP